MYSIIYFKKPTKIIRPGSTSTVRKNASDLCIRVLKVIPYGKYFPSIKWLWAKRGVL